MDLVVFTAPRLSFFELKRVADALTGRKVSDRVDLILATSSITCRALEEQGLPSAITDAGGVVLQAPAGR